MSKYEEANLILKLYDLRREPILREARSWYFLEFNPESMSDYNKLLFSEHSGHMRMVMTYWDMAAALVNNGAIGRELFTETSGECFAVFAKIEPILAEVRAVYGPNFLANLEKLVDATPGGRERTAATREMVKTVRSRVAAQQGNSPGLRST